MATERVEAGKGIDLGTMGADNKWVVVQKLEYVGDKMPKDFKFRPDPSLTSWVCIDNVFREEPVEGFIKPGDYATGRLMKKIPEVTVFSYTEYPVDVAVPVAVKIRGGDSQDSGSTPVRGSLRLSIKFNRVSPKKVQRLLTSPHKDFETDDMDVRATFMTAKDLQDILSEAMADSLRQLIFSQPYAYENIENIEAQIVEHYNQVDYFVEKGLAISSAFLRIDETALEGMDNAELRAKIKMKNMEIDARIDKMRKDLHLGDDRDTRSI